MRKLAQLFATSVALAGLAVPALAGEWREGAPSMTGHAFSASAQLRDEIYVAGGAGITTPQSSFEAYDTIGDIWRSLPALPTGVQQAAMATLNGRLYLSGGYTAESKGPDNAALWMFDPAVGLWQRGADMPGARAWHQMVSVNGRLYVLGGVGPRSERVFIFDPMEDEWTTLSAPIPEPRTALAATVHEGEIYVLGGRLTNGAPTARVDILNPASGAWSSGPALPEARAGLGAAVLAGRIHVAGGEQQSPPRTFDDHFVLETSSGRWQQLEPLKTPRHGAAVASSGGQLFVVGGATGPGVYTVFTVSDLVSIYQP